MPDRGGEFSSFRDTNADNGKGWQLHYLKSYDHQILRTI